MLHLVIFIYSAPEKSHSFSFVYSCPRKTPLAQLLLQREPGVFFFLP